MALFPTHVPHFRCDLFYLIRLRSFQEIKASGHIANGSGVSLKANKFKDNTPIF